MVVCCLTPTEVRLFLERGQLPDCANSNPNSSSRGPHAHVKVSRAHILVGKDDGSGDAIWIGSGCRMLYQAPPKVWRAKDSTEYANRERVSSVRVMQMVEIRGHRPAVLATQ